MRLAVQERHLRVLERALREALAAGLLRDRELHDARELLDLVDRQLPAAEERQYRHVGPDTARLLLREEILRLLGVAEDDGRGSLTRREVDERLADKPEGTSIRGVLDELRRDKLIFERDSAGDGLGFVELTREGRARARRPPAGGDPAEHAVLDPAQLLDLIYRARGGGSTRYHGDREERVDQIWHVPIVQACAGVDAEQFDALAAALQADGLIGPGAGSYLTITDAGEKLAAQRFREHRLPGVYEPSRLLPPARRPRELRRRSEDLACPNCGHYASWLRTRKGKRYEELRATGVVEHKCTRCNVIWTIYTEPVDRRGEYDPFGAPAVCRPRWAYRGGYWYDEKLAPPDHYTWQGR
jgi:hypothetical protein